VVANPVMLKMSSRGAWVLVASTGLSLFGLGCRRHDAAEQANAPAKPAASVTPPEAAPLDLTPGEPPAPNRFAGDAQWQRARGGEEIDLMRLAHREGAAGLIEGFAVGRSVGLTALAALPHADDAELALSRLCEELAHDRAPSLPVLRALQGIVARPPEPREALAASGYAECVPVVDRLAKLPSLDPERHDLVSSTAGLLVEHREAARR